MTNNLVGAAECILPGKKIVIYLCTDLWNIMRILDSDYGPLQSD